MGSVSACTSEAEGRAAGGCALWRFNPFGLLGAVNLAAGPTQPHSHPAAKIWGEEREIWLKIPFHVLARSPPSFTLTANPTESTGRRKLL